MDIRQRILDAARRVYAQHGFRGATTRLIATEANVNEVTLFRTFGSKSALFECMLEWQATESPMPRLPLRPVDPAAEMTEWCATVLRYMREHRALLRKGFGEMEDRPDAAASMCNGANGASMMLVEYARALQEDGLAEPDADTQTAAAMLISSMFGDAISRDVMPHAFPEPVEEAPVRYVRVFLRALGVKATKRRAAVSRSVSTA